MSLNDFSTMTHQESVNAGWWRDMEYCKEIYETLSKADGLYVTNNHQEFDGLDIEKIKDLLNKYMSYRVAGAIALIHSELSEALEAYRKDKMDEHLTHRKGVEVELADAMIRIGDLAGFLQLDLDNTSKEKIAYNQQRLDHKLEVRAAEGGKKF